MGTLAISDEERYRQVAAIRSGNPEAEESLLGALKDPSWRVRRVAIDRLATFARSRGKPVVLVDKLVALLGQRGETGGRNAAAEALVLLGKDSIPSLIELLEQGDADKKKFAAEILGRVGKVEASAPLAKAAEDADINVRVAALEALGQVGGPAAAPALEKALEGAVPLVRLAALEAMIQLRRPMSIDSLNSLLQDPALIKSAYRVLGLVPEPSFTERILLGFTAPTKSVREAAVAALGLQTSLATPDQRQKMEQVLKAKLATFPDLSGFLASALKATDVDVLLGALFLASVVGQPQLALAVAESAVDDRIARDAIRTLEHMGPEAGRELLVNFDRLSLGARVAAAESMEAVAHPSLLELLLKALSTEELELQLGMVRALGKCRSVEAIPALVSRLTSPGLSATAARALVVLAQAHPVPVLRALEEAGESKPTPALVYALAQVGGPDALATLRRTLRHPEEQVRAMSAQALCEVGGEACLELVQLSMADESPVVRRAAARGLGSLSSAGERVVVLLRQGLTDPDPDVQAASIDSAGSLLLTQLTPELELHVRQPDGRRASRAIRALARLGKAPMALVREAARHPDPEVVKEAVNAAASHPDGLTLALELIRHGQWDVRAAAARVIALAGDKSCLPRVEDALVREADPSTRAALTEAARQLQHR